MDHTPKLSEESQQPIDIGFKIGRLTISLSLLVLLTSTGLFIPLITPLFKPGPPIVADIGVHYSAIACYKKGTMWSLPTAWCSHGQAGLARFQRYGVIHAYLTVILSWFMPLEWAFKIMMLLTFLTLPVVAYSFLRWLGYPLSGAIAYGLLLLETGGQNWGGYKVHFLLGGFINVFANGLSLLTIFTLVWMLGKVTPLRVVIASLVSATYFLSHPGSALWFPLALVPLLILYRKEVLANRDYLFLYALLSFNFIAFWFIPAFHKTSYFNPPGLGFLSSFSYYQFFTAMPPVRRYMVLIGLIAGLYLLISRERRLKLLGAILFIIPLAWNASPYLPSSYSRYFTIDRSFYEFRTFAILCSSLILGGCLPKPLLRYRFTALCIGTLIFFSMIFHLYPSSFDQSRFLFTAKEIDSLVLPVYDYVRNASGRILAENTFSQFYLQPISFTQPWALSAHYSDKEFLGNSDFWYTPYDYSLAYRGSIFGIHITNYSLPDFAKLLWHLNVQYLWTSTHLDEHIRKIIPLATQFNGTFGTMWETPWEHSYLHYWGGKLTNVSYQTIRASAVANSSTGGTILFKVREWPNWKATIDGMPVPITRDEYGLMRISIPAGQYRVLFEYRMLFVDWIGYIITFITAAGALVWVCVSKTNTPPSP